MATPQTKTVDLINTDYQRGVMFEDIDHDRVANAIRYLSFAKLYYPDKYHEFLKVVALHRATWSMEDSNFITALYEFERGFTEFLATHPAVEQEVNRLSPKQMVDRVDADEVVHAKERRDAARKIAQRVVASAAKRGAQPQREEEVEEAVRSAAVDAETPARLQQLIKERIPIAVPVVDQIVQDDPRIMQKLLLSDPQSTRGVLDHVVFSPLPNKRALHTIITRLPMDPNETRTQFLNRAQSVAQTAMALSSDLSQTPAARADPGALVGAMLQASGNKTALKAFEQLTQQAKNAVSLIAVASAWEKTVDVITRHAGGVLAQSIEPIIQEANKQPVGGSTKQVALLVGDVINPLLGRTFERLMELETLNMVSPDKTMAIVSSPQTLLLLAAYTWKPEGVTFEQRRIEGSLEPVAWVVRWAADSAFGKVVGRAAKAATGAATKVAGEGVKRGVAALLTKLGLSALAGIFTGGTSLLAQAAIWVGGKALGWLWRAGAWFFSARWLTSLFGFGAPSAPKKWYEQDWVPIVIIIAIAVLIPIFGAMLQITTTNSALVVANQFVGTETDFTGETSEKPDASRVSPECLGNDFPMPSADGARTSVVGGRTYAFPVAPYGRTYHTCGHHDGLYATDIGIIGVNTDDPHAGLAVVAYTSGVISMTRLDDPKGGKYIILRGDDGRSYYYAHSCALYVRPGERVSAGQVIAASGDTGSASTTPEHVHFAISGAGESFFRGGNSCPASDFEQKFGLGKCSAQSLCPTK